MALHVCTDKFGGLPLLHLLLRYKFDSDIFARFMKQPNLDVNAKCDKNTKYHISYIEDPITQAWYHFCSPANLSLLLQHKDITLSIAKENIKDIQRMANMEPVAHGRYFKLREMQEKGQTYMGECLGVLFQYAKTVESGKKWNHNKSNNYNNDTSQTIINEGNTNANTSNMKVWKYKELWKNVVLEALNVSNNKELPDLWLHLLIKYCNRKRKSKKRKKTHKYI